MPLAELLADKRSAIIKNWRQQIVGTYPGETQRFLTQKKDRFANPVGYSISQMCDSLYDELIGENDYERQSKILDEVIKIRAVQDFEPSAALHFVFVLKDVLRETLVNELDPSEVLGEYLNFENKIDRLAELAFDLYMKRRELIYKLRTAETQQYFKRIIDRVNQVSDIKHGIENRQNIGSETQGGEQ